MISAPGPRADEARRGGIERYESAMKVGRFKYGLLGTAFFFTTYTGAATLTTFTLSTQKRRHGPNDRFE